MRGQNVNIGLKPFVKVRIQSSLHQPEGQLLDGL
jgi:hypothetical protein